MANRNLSSLSLYNSRGKAWALSHTFGELTHFQADRLRPNVKTLRIWISMRQKLSTSPHTVFSFTKTDNNCARCVTQQHVLTQSQALRTSYAAFHIHLPQTMLSPPLLEVSILSNKSYIASFNVPDPERRQRAARLHIVGIQALLKIEPQSELYYKTLVEDICNAISGQQRDRACWCDRKCKSSSLQCSVPPREDTIDSKYVYRSAF